MKRHEVTDEQWELIRPILPKRTAKTGRRPSDPRVKDSPVNGTSATVFRADERPMSLGENGLGVWKRFPDKPKRRSRPAAIAFFSPRRRPSPESPSRALMPHVRHRSELVDVDRGQLVGRRLKDIAIVMDLHELTPVGGRAPGRRDGRRLERLAEVCENLPDRPWLCDERNQPDVAAAHRALERKLLSHPGDEFRPGDPGGVVRPGPRLSVAAAPRGVTVARMPAGTGIVRFGNVPDGQCRDGPPQPVVRRKHPVIPMPVLPRRRDEIGEPVEELKRREFHDASGSRPRGLAAGPDPVGGFVSGQHVADAGDLAVWAADHGEPLECEGGPGAVSEKMLETPNIARHVAGEERYPDTGVD